MKKGYILYVISSILRGGWSHWGRNKWTHSLNEAHLFRNRGTAKRFAQSIGLKTHEYKVIEVEIE